jgi:hypothetical protein
MLYWSYPSLTVQLINHPQLSNHAVIHQNHSKSINGNNKQSTGVRGEAEIESTYWTKTSASQHIGLTSFHKPAAGTIHITTQSHMIFTQSRDKTSHRNNVFHMSIRCVSQVILKEITDFKNGYNRCIRYTHSQHTALAGRVTDSVRLPAELQRRCNSLWL